MAEQFIWAPKVIGRSETERGTMFSVESDRRMSRDHPECVGWPALLEGNLWEVIGCERNMPSTDIHQGEKIGLLVRPTE